MALVLGLPLAAATLESAPVAAADGALTRYPYLTDSAQSSVTLNWATTRASSTGSVNWGPSGSCSANTVSATPTAISVNGVPEYQWKAVLPVTSDTTYCYRVFLAGNDLLGSDPSPSFTSQVAKGSTTPYSFAVLGDWGSAPSTSVNLDQANVMTQVAQSGARFAVVTGDTGYPDGSQANFGDLQQTGANVSAVFGPQYWTVPGRSLPLFNVPGNHGFTNGDVQTATWPEQTAATASGGRYAVEPVPSVNGSAPGNYPNFWYAFDAGGARFYMLTAAWDDNNGSDYANDAAAHFTPGAAEYEWLKQDLANHPGGLKFAFWHYPIFADGEFPLSDTYLQGGPGTLQGLLDSNNVQMAFNGHGHSYQRHAPDPAGLVTYVVGNSGASLDELLTCSAFDAYGIGAGGTHCGAAPATSPKSEVFGFVKVTVDGMDVTVTPTSSTGRTYDVQTYHFPRNETDSTPPSAPTGVSVSDQSLGSTQVTWTASTDNVAVTGYKIYRNPGPFGGPSGDVLVGTVSGTTTTFEDPAVAPATAYAYKVTAIDAAGNTSAFSSPGTITTTGAADTTPPSTPGGLTGTAGSSGEVTLNWQASSDNVRVTGYRVSRDGAVLGDVATPATSFVDDGAAIGSTHTYSVSAYDASGNVSAAATITTGGGGTVNSLTFAPTADTWIDQSSPTTNHGTSTRLTADNSPVNDALLKFTVSGTGTGTTCPTITGARLTMTVGNSTYDDSDRGGDLYATTNATWSENTVNWNNAPPTSGSPLSSITTPVNLNTAYTFDASTAVTNNGTITLRLKNTSTDGARYFSKEGSTASAPQLQVTCGS